ncbi:MAG: type II toxin-antitoxin system Phd/YefM family antitoxin [Candidatus Komeilibacteria bacterium]|nr:type II toxin-antitoxin system Phd/YefM family antitoxin [Candidatus Komeilibacteria bacterium]
MLQNAATEARKRFQETIDHVHYNQENMMITKHGKPWVVIQPVINNTANKFSKHSLKGETFSQKRHVMIKKAK